jgi:hypothetical protein
VSRPRPDNDNAAKKPAEPQTPYPVDRPRIDEQPGRDPDYVPPTPNDLPKM